MKTMLRKTIMSGLVATALMLSCTNLDEELFDTVTADNFFKTQEEFIAALGQAYSSLGGLGNHANLWSIQEISSDELVITTKGGDWYDGGVLIQLHQHTFSPSNGFFNNAWGFMYGGVNTCNRLIYQFEQLLSSPDPTTVELANKTISELRALRALWYYWLLDADGNVPIVTDFTATGAPANNTNFGAGRTAVYNFVESELLDVLDDLPTEKTSTTYGRMTRWAAQAILTKLYLNAEVYTGTPQWNKVITAADDIIDNGGFSLEGLYSDNFAIQNSGSRENIFVYPYDKVFAQGFNWPMMTLHYASQGVYRFTMQPWNGYAVVEEFYNSYVDPVQNPGPQGPVWLGLCNDADNNGISDDTGTLDERLSNFVVGPQYNPDGSRAVDPAAESFDPDGPPLTFTPENNEIFPNGWRQGGARIGKYQFEVGGTNNMSNDFVIFRLADIILAKAEALWRINNADPEALTLVNQIRDRAGVDLFTSLDADKLLAERGREMFAEMTRRQDLIRFGKWDDAWWEKPASPDPKYRVFPIPQVQIDANANLTQNPGY